MTAMRRGEITFLAWDDIKYVLKMILIQDKPDIREPKTGERVIPISAMVENMLRKQLENRRSDIWAFPNRAGKPDRHLLEKMKKSPVRQGSRNTAFTVFATHLQRSCA